MRLSTPCEVPQAVENPMIAAVVNKAARIRVLREGTCMLLRSGGRSDLSSA